MYLFQYKWHVYHYIMESILSLSLSPSPLMCVVSEGRERKGA